MYLALRQLSPQPPAPHLLLLSLFGPNGHSFLPQLLLGKVFGDFGLGLDGRSASGTLESVGVVCGVGHDTYGCFAEIGEREG
jgi:hypothetical protein